MDQNNQHHNNDGAAGSSFLSNLFRGILPHSSLSDQHNADHSTAHSEIPNTANQPEASTDTDIVMSDDEPIADLIAHPSAAPDASQSPPNVPNVDSAPPMRAEYAQNYSIPPPATVDHDDARSDSSMPDLQSVSDSSDDEDAQSERDAYDVEMHLAVADDGDSAWTDESMPPLEPAISDPAAQRRRVAVEEVPDPDAGDTVPTPMPANPQHQQPQPQPHLHLPPNIRPLVPPFLHLPRPQNGGQDQGQGQTEPQTLPPFATLMADLTQSFAADGQPADQGQGQQQAHAHVHYAHPHSPPPPFPQPPQHAGQAGDEPANENQHGNAPPHGHFHFHNGPNGGMLALSFDMTIIPVASSSTAGDAQPAPVQGEAPESQTQAQGQPAPNPNPQQPRPGNVNVQILDDTGAEHAQWNGTSLTDVLNMFGMLGMPVTAPEGGEAPDIVRAIMQTLMAFSGASMEPEHDDPARARKLVHGLEVVPEGLVKRMERLAKEEGDTGGMSAGCAVCWEPLFGEDAGSGWEENKQDADGDVTMDGVQDAATLTEGSGMATPQVSSSTAEPHDQPTTTTPAGTPPTQADAGTTPAIDNADEEPLPRIVALPCSHVFHSACLVPWFARPRQTTCPTCRFDIDPEGLTQGSPRRPMPRPPPAQDERRARMQARQERAQWRTTFGAGATPTPGQAATTQQAPVEPALASQPQSQQAQPQPQQPQADAPQPEPQVPRPPRSPPRADAQPTFVPLNFAGGPEMSGIVPVIVMPLPAARFPHLHHHHPQYQQHSPMTALNRAQTAFRDELHLRQQEPAPSEAAGQQPQQSQARTPQHEGPQLQPASARAPQPIPQLAQPQIQPQMPQLAPREFPRPHYQAQPLAFPPFRFGVPPPPVPAPAPAPAPVPAPARTNAPPRRKPTWTLPPPPGPTLRQRIEQRERDAALRCDDVSCGIGPSDEDPTPVVLPGAEKMVFICPSQAQGDGDGRVCAHRFHSACLVVSERVAGWGLEDKGEAGPEVEVSCPVCRAVGVVSREEWQEGARAAV